MLLLYNTIYPILLILLPPAFSLRFYISSQSDDEYVFNKGVDATISVITGLISFILLLPLLAVTIISIITAPTILMVLSSISIISINIIITRYYMPKIIHLFASDKADGIFYFIGLIFMFSSAFLLPVAFLISKILKQVTTQNYFYKLYTEEKDKGRNKE